MPKNIQNYKTLHTHPCKQFPLINLKSTWNIASHVHEPQLPAFERWQLAMFGEEMPLMNADMHAEEFVHSSRFGRKQNN